MQTNLKIEKLVYGGQGMGFLEKLPVFVQMAVPGDEVICEITKKNKGYLEGRIVKVLKASPNRVCPKCEYFGRCGGCQWQHIDYSAQILWKQIVIEEQFSRIGKLRNANVLPTIPSPKIWNYRGRVRLHHEGEKEGFFAAGSRELVEIKDCLIADLKNAAGSDFFTQVNPLQNENLKMLVKKMVQSSGAKTLLELYCGNGNLTFPLVDTLHRIEASDSDKKGILDAKKSLEICGADNVEFFHESAKATVTRVLKEKKKFDTLLIDPPRDGCKDIVPQIIKIGFKNIVYVSCNPATLARDAGELVKAGYKLESCQPIDMFPQTFHIESVSLFRK